ncbi:hypothetical protein LCGC14_0648050 [marine sediment metagenome]|uniref:Uncharacterized protein n=1 Tax=marine sediment metagenome TaxID=412755 RepID=A0A0F9RGS8_9ZZZZ
MTWKIIPISFAGTVLTNTDREAHFLRGFNLHNVPSPTPVTVPRLGGFPTYVRTQPASGKAFPVEFILLNNTQAVVETLRQLFDSVDGTALLVVEDGDAIQKRILTVRQGVVYSDGIWIGSLWAPDPTLFANNLSTSTIDALGDAAADFSPTPNNLGDTPTKPLFRIEPQALKSPLESWALTREITYAWRSELPAAGPVSGSWLLELTDGGWDTEAIIDVSGINTTINQVGGIALGATPPFDIVVVSTAGFDQEGMLMITPGGTREQFAYTIKNATEFTITARGLRMAPVAHSDGATIDQSRMLADGDDIAVFIDGVEVDRSGVYLSGIDIATTQIWIELKDSPAISAEAPTGTSGTTVFVMREEHPFVVGDYLVVNSGNFEQVRVTAVDGRTITIERGVRKTIATTITAGTLFYRSSHRIQLAYYWSGAPVLTAPLNTPIIDLVNSKNNTWLWANELYSQAREAGGWRRILYPGSNPVPTNRLRTKIGLDSSIVTKASFVDVEPSSEKPNYDALEFIAACGIDTTDGIEYDATIDWPFALQVIGRDFSGFETLIVDRLGHESGNSHEPPVTETDRQEDPATSLAAVILRARNIIVTGALIPSDSNVLALQEAPIIILDTQLLSLDADTELAGIVTRVKKATAGTKTLLLQILESSGADGIGGVIAGILTHTLTSSSFLEVCQFYSSPSPVLPSGKVHIAIYESTGTGEIEIVKSIVAVYPTGAHWQFDSVKGYQRIQNEDLWVHFLSLTADNQVEMLPSEKRTGLLLELDNVQLRFDATRTPIAEFRAVEDAYYIDDTISRIGQSFRIRFLERWADLQSESVEIDVAAKTVIFSKDSDSIRQTLQSDDDDWLVLLSGATTVTVTPNGGAGTTDENHTLEYRSAWQA